MAVVSVMARTPRPLGPSFLRCWKVNGKRYLLIPVSALKSIKMDVEHDCWTITIPMESDDYV